MESARRAPRAAYVILANPFIHERNNPSSPSFNGPVRAVDVLRVHLLVLAERVTSFIAALLVVWPNDSDRLEVPGVRNISHVGLPYPLEVVNVANNSLGSYGMFLHAFATTRNRFDYYIFCEDDYVPVPNHFDAALIRMHDHTFADARPGVLAGVLQGRPAEPESRRVLHLETSHIMSSQSLHHLFEYVFSTVRWNGSLTDRMLHLLQAAGRPSNAYYGGAVQEGFGALMIDSGIEMRDWSLAYRSPYWNHAGLIDWSGAASSFSLPIEDGILQAATGPWVGGAMLFAPVQSRHASTIQSCCDASEAACRDPIRSCTVVLTHQTGQLTRDCCQRLTEGNGQRSHLIELRTKLSLPREAARLEREASVITASHARLPHHAYRVGRQPQQQSTCSVMSHLAEGTPMRSPLSVHSRLLHRFTGRHVVALGARNGDGIACFSSAAQSAQVIERDEASCMTLRQRAKRLQQRFGRGFTVMCTSYEHAVLPRGSDLSITWWQEQPYLDNADILAWLNKSRFQLHESTEAVLLFELGYKPDADSWASLVAAGTPWLWTELVSFDESESCARVTGAHNGLCSRAKSTFRIASVLVRSLASASVGHRKRHPKHTGARILHTPMLGEHHTR